ncbi:hypothetical protein DFA_07654 [Cavenderia fasciculata]|uniref:MICOS complex subunit MIC10 n=1 Tax=Cavenderia fasciculata TaxID=261658 RepID=F4Q2J7_CACFS|nr:uncharacterized protein DFA_07654 [Cavenderia fasciculata]EGG16676.1 hypothetical protein DFA_07654 [Cavenderia fasciculata]|eukprot:XP_004355150.1 hypothetical protein DFA_07654 [Cavenderia fasciculata]
MSDNKKPPTTAAEKVVEKTPVIRSKDDVKFIERTEQCVENVLKKTTIGALAPLGLLLVTSKLKFIGTCMIFGAGVGLGLSVKDCNNTTTGSCHTKSFIPSTSSSSSSSSTSDCKTGTCPVPKRTTTTAAPAAVAAPSTSSPSIAVVPPSVLKTDADEIAKSL